MPQICPRCDLLNPDDASRCDCGFRTTSQPSQPSLPDTEARVWYYMDCGKTCGPVTLDDLKVRNATGFLKPDDEIWRKGTADWVRAESVAGLRSNCPAVNSVPTSPHRIESSQSTVSPTSTSSDSAPTTKPANHVVEFWTASDGF